MFCDDVQRDIEDKNDLLLFVGQDQVVGHQKEFDGLVATDKDDTICTQVSKHIRVLFDNFSLFGGKCDFNRPEPPTEVSTGAEDRETKN